MLASSVPGLETKDTMSRYQSLLSITSERPDNEGSIDEVVLVGGSTRIPKIQVSTGGGPGQASTFVL